jgi:hypothetical protein
MSVQLTFRCVLKSATLAGEKLQVAGRFKGEAKLKMSEFGFAGRYFIIHARLQQSQFHLVAEYLTCTVWQYPRIPVVSVSSSRFIPRS